MTKRGLAWPLGLAALAGAAFLAAVWFNRSVGHPEVLADRWHHLYLGLGLALVAARTKSPVLLWIGALIALDDAWQHVFQLVGTWDYRSPLHQLYAQVLWPLEPVQWVTRALDALFALV